MVRAFLAALLEASDIAEERDFLELSEEVSEGTTLRFRGKGSVRPAIAKDENYLWGGQMFH